MSWFDATGIASLAKNALKEAQKTIDKALDISEDEHTEGDVKASLESSQPMSEKRNINKTLMKQSMSNPILSSVASATTATNLWESFTGSFFDASAGTDGQGKTAVTVPPTSSTRKDSKTLNENVSGRTSSASASESVEVLSSPVSSLSEPPSPSSNVQGNGSSASCITLQQTHTTQSESIEVIGTRDETPISSDLLSPESNAPNITSASCTSISDSVEVIDSSSVGIELDSPSIALIGSVEEISTHVEDEDEDESTSYNTVSENTTPVTIVDTSNTTQSQKPITTPPSRSTLSLPLTTKLAVAKPSARPNYLDKSLESFEAQTQLSDSTQSFEDVQQMLIDDAVASSIKPTSSASAQSFPRENSTSPPSSEDKHDLVKVGVSTSVDHNSGHTSADEVETATSSDIEIISGPNGDSSSTNSAAGFDICKASPLKAKLAGHLTKHDAWRRGHNRDWSGTSTYSMQSESGSDGNTEMEKLQHRVHELSEVIEVRELKLVELGRENAKLFEKNAELMHQLDTMKARTEPLDTNSIADEYTQRLSALERKFQQTLRERDTLRNELQTIQSSLTKSISKEDYERQIKDKDDMIDALRTEGEKLSKQILQHSNIIKKLRAKEKETDAIIKRQTEQIDEMSMELERSKKSLSAKDEIERNQMEAVHKLTSENKKLSKEMAKVKSELEDMTQRSKTLQTSFDAAKNELNDKHQDLQSLTRKTKNLTALQSEQSQLQQQNQQLSAELEMLREKLKSDANEQNAQNQKLRQENAALLRRIEEIEQRNEEQAQVATEATIPLVRQCESLQATLNNRTSAWQKQENAFIKRIESLESKLANVAKVERNATEHSDELNTRIQSLENSLSKALLRSEQAATALQQKQVELELLQNDFAAKQAATDESKRNQEKIIEELKVRIVELEQKIQRISQTCDSRRKTDEQREKSADNESGSIGDNGSDKELRRIEGNASPTPSVGRASITDSHASAHWQLDDFESVSTFGHHRRPSMTGSLYGAFGGGSAMIETLQATLKQRDGENQQLQWQLSRLQSERNFLMTEVSTLAEQLDGIKEKLASYDSLETQFNELQTQYDAVLQMYGEKVEEKEELQLDLQDVKDMYRAQIDDLLVQQRQLQQQIATLQQSSTQ